MCALQVNSNMTDIKILYGKDDTKVKIVVSKELHIFTFENLVT